MAFIPVPDTAEVEVRQMLFGQLIENTLYFVLTGGWDEESLSNLAVAVADWFVTDILPSLSAELTLREVVARDISSSTGAQAVDLSHAGAAGSDDSGSAPSNVALAVSFRTAFSGRSFRGRNYIAGFGLENVVSNQVFSTAADAIASAYNLLQSLVSTAIPGAQWCVVSRFHAGLPRISGVATPVTGASLTDYFVDSQRKRLTGRGQ